LGLPGGFRGWPIQWNHAKCCGADPCCHGNKIWARHGDPVAYQLVVVIVVAAVAGVAFDFWLILANISAVIAC